jgi:hypothetical protein
MEIMEQQPLQFDALGITPRCGWRTRVNGVQAQGSPVTKLGEQILDPSDTNMMKVDKIQCWNVLLGFHQARIVDARLIKKCVNNRDEFELRLIFEITSLVHPTKQYMAKKVYRKGDSIQIITDLEHLLGNDIHSVINLQGEIIGEGLVRLVGKQVDIEIEHHQGKNHDEPFCLVTQVTNPGVLIEQIKDAA